MTLLTLLVKASRQVTNINAMSEALNGYYSDLTDYTEHNDYKYSTAIAGEQWSLHTTPPGHHCNF